jgi:hypothetical protein
VTVPCRSLSSLLVPSRIRESRSPSLLVPFRPCLSLGICDHFCDQRSASLHFWERSHPVPEGDWAAEPKNEG